MRPEDRKTCVTVRGLNSTDVPKDLSCTTLAVPAATRWKLAAKRKAREKNESKKRVRRICGSVHRGSKTNAGTLWYSTRIKFDAMHIYTRGRLDLQTALEYLVILTSVKQKMQEVANKGLRPLRNACKKLWLRLPKGKEQTSIFAFPFSRQLAL